MVVPIYVILQRDGTLTPRQITTAAHIVAKHPPNGVALRFVDLKESTNLEVRRPYDPKAFYVYTNNTSDDTLNIEEVAIKKTGELIPWDCVTNKLVLNQLINALAHVIREKGEEPEASVVPGPVTPIRRRELINNGVHGTYNYYDKDGKRATVFRPFNRAKFGGKMRYSAEGFYLLYDVAHDVENELMRQSLWFIPTWVLDYLLPRRTLIFVQE